MQRAALYAGVSTDAQKQEGTIESQIAELRRQIAAAKTKFTFDYQFIDNPAYNTNRGPMNVFAGRVHWQF
jgi:high affinity Mn2+ porin